jgi:alpha-1,3/alpha-1,6-mannosyltransferase
MRKTETTDTAITNNSMPSSSSVPETEPTLSESLSQAQQKLQTLKQQLNSQNPNPKQSAAAQTARPLHVVFLHLDLGIGGAEQLVLQLATASQDLGHRVDLVTTRCDPHHCFAAVKPGTGNLHHALHVWGRWIPATILLGYGQAVCSTIRLLYLAYRVARKKSPDIIVLDVLPTPLPLLMTSTDASLLFYCHFPDKLLTRSNKPTTTGGDQLHEPVISKLKQFYRSVMDGLEEWSIQSADVCAVNSKFTRATVLNTFPSLGKTNGLPVLYPALDTTSLDSMLQVDAGHQDDENDAPKGPVFVSLNRYERKKNLGLLLEAAAWLRQNRSDLTSKFPEIQIVVAGGYDVQCVENVEYRAELGQMATELKIQVKFMQSISDAVRADLLRTATAVIYTPENEHFGIVPLEAMYAGTPVVACRSGGPVETILHNETGFLCEPTAASFGQALATLLEDPVKTAAMGKQARKHVLGTFGKDRLQTEWKELLEETLVKGRERMTGRRHYRLARNLIYVVEAVVTLMVCLVLTYILRRLGMVEPSESIWSTVRKAIGRDEL